MADLKDKNGSLYYKLLLIIHEFLTGLRKNLILLIVCIASVTSLMFVYNYKSADVYSTSFTVMYKELVRKIYGDRLAKVDVLVQKEDHKKLISLLGISEDAVKSIVSIKGKNILGEDLDKDLNTDRIPFVVELHFDDVTYAEEIQNGIINYLENGNTYLKDKMALKIQETKSELQFIENQLSKLDTLKRKFNNLPNALKEGKDKMDPSSIYEFSYSLFKKKQELESDTAMPSNLNVVDDVIVPIPTKRSSFFVLTVGFVLGFMLYMVLAYLIIPAYKLKP